MKLFIAYNREDSHVVTYGICQDWTTKTELGNRVADSMHEDGHDFCLEDIEERGAVVEIATVACVDDDAPIYREFAHQYTKNHTQVDVGALGATLYATFDADALAARYEDELHVYYGETAETAT